MNIQIRARFTPPLGLPVLLLLAAAIRCGAAVIVTYNVGDFPVDIVQERRGRAQGEGLRGG